MVVVTCIDIAADFALDLDEHFDYLILYFGIEPHESTNYIHLAENGFEEA